MISVCCSDANAASLHACPATLQLGPPACASTGVLNACGVVAAQPAPPQLVHERLPPPPQPPPARAALLTRQELQIAGVNFKAFDLGGHEIARKVWKDYYAKVRAAGGEEEGRRTRKGCSNRRVAGRRPSGCRCLQSPGATVLGCHSTGCPTCDAAAACDGRRWHGVAAC